MSSVRWENAQLRIFQDGRDIGTTFAEEFSADTDLQVDKVKHMGRETPDIDASYNGGTGSITLDEQAGSVNIDNMLDAHEAGLRRRDNTGRVTILVSKRHDDGTVIAYRYANAIVMRNTRGSQNQRFKTSLRFEFAQQERVQ